MTACSKNSPVMPCMDCTICQESKRDILAFVLDPSWPPVTAGPLYLKARVVTVPCRTKAPTRQSPPRSSSLPRKPSLAATPIRWTPPSSAWDTWPVATLAHLISFRRRSRSAAPRDHSQRKPAPYWSAAFQKSPKPSPQRTAVRQRPPIPKAIRPR